MLKSDIKSLELALQCLRNRDGTVYPISEVHLAILSEYAKLDWRPWTQDSLTESLFPSDQSMSAAAEASRTAYSIMHLTKDELIEIHNKEAFEGFEETLANLDDAAKMLRAVVEMIEGAHGRMVASACACLTNQHVQNARIENDRRPRSAARLKRRLRRRH
jgi:hypothetical protein